MRAIDADALNSIKFHPLPYTHITPSDADAESYKRGWNDAIDSIIENAPTIEPEPQWIPVSERVPEENVPVLLGVRFKDDFKFFVSARIDYNYWSGLGREIKGELRWMPLPSPYREDGGE